MAVVCCRRVMKDTQHHLSSWDRRFSGVVASFMVLRASKASSVCISAELVIRREPCKASRALCVVGVALEGAV